MQDYNTIIGAIQMRLNKCPTRSVMDRFRIGSSTLNLIMRRYKALELTIDELEAMSPKKVENLFYPQKNLQRKEVPLPDFQYYYDRIHAPNSRVNISFCWLDYKEKNPDGYEKSQFYEYYQRFVQENYGGTKISMAVNRKPGEKMYIVYFLFLSYTIIQLTVPPLINSNTIHRKILLLSPVFGFCTADVDVVVESFFGIVAGAMVVPV